MNLKDITPEQQQEAAKRDPDGYDLVNLTQPIAKFGTKVDYQESFKTDRCSVPKNSLIGKAIQRERKELKIFLESVFDNRTFDFICYIPNSRLPWFNKVVKRVIATKIGLSKADLAYIKNFWMDEVNLTALVAFSEHIKGDGLDFTVEPPRTKQGIQLTSQKGEIGAKIANPGFVSLSDKSEEIENLLDTIDVYKERLENIPKPKTMSVSQILNKYRKYIEGDVQDDLDNPFENEHSYLDSGLYKHLRLLGEHMHGEIWDVNFIFNLARKLHSQKEEQANMYLLTLLNPWLPIKSGVPSTGFAPSGKFKLTTKITQITNLPGNLGWVLNPYLLLLGNTTSCFGVNNDVTLTGLVNSPQFKAVSIGQGIPAAFYSRYRVVSAGICAKYIGSDLSAAGYITQGLDYGANITQTAIGTHIPNSQVYSIFSTVDNTYFTQTTANNEHKANTILWAPDDFTSQNYFDLSTTNVNSPVLVGYCSGGQSSAPVVELSIVINYEALISNNYSDYFPSEVYKGSYDNLKNAATAIDTLRSSNSTNLSDVVASAAKVMQETSNREPETTDLSETNQQSEIVKNIISKIGVLPQKMPKIETPKMKIQKAGFLKSIGTKLLDFIADNVPVVTIIKDTIQGKPIAETGEKLGKQLMDFIKIMSKGA